MPTQNAPSFAALSLLAAMLACHLSPAQAQKSTAAEHTVMVQGIERRYLLHLPPNPTHPAPVVFVFHGGGGRPEAIEHSTGMDALADQHGFLAVYPAGLPGPSKRGGTWNVGGAFAPHAAADVAFVQAILHDLEHTVPIDHARIYSTGLSMGGVFSYRLACELSDTFAAIAPVSATMVEPSCHPHSPVAVLHIHGTNDNRIPLKGGRGELTAAGRSWPPPQQGISLWSQFDGCHGEPSQHTDGPAACTTYPQCRATVEFCVINGGQHPWPASFPAAQRIWTFFAAHPKHP